MQCYWITPQGLERREQHEIADLLKREDGFVWLDVLDCGDEAGRLPRCM